MFRVLLIGLALLTSAPVFAGNDHFEHLFVIYNDATDVKLTVSVPAQKNPTSTVFVSRWDESQQKDVVSMQAETSGIQITTAPSMIDPDPVTGFKGELGRSGEIEVRILDETTCEVQSTLREFYVPQPTKMECSYFLVTGKRPGFTGSNVAL